MKLALSTITLAAAISTGAAFAPSTNYARLSTSIANQLGDGMDLSGNSWKPDSEKMGSTGKIGIVMRNTCVEIEYEVMSSAVILLIISFEAMPHHVIRFIRTLQYD